MYPFSGGQKAENVHASLTWMRRCKTGKFAEMMESELWDHFLSCFHRNYMFGRKGGFGFEKKLPSKDQLAWLEMKQVCIVYTSVAFWKGSFKI